MPAPGILKLQVFTSIKIREFKYFQTKTLKKKKETFSLLLFEWHKLSKPDISLGPACILNCPWRWRSATPSLS